MINNSKQLEEQAERIRHKKGGLQAEMGTKKKACGT